MLLRALITVAIVGAARVTSGVAKTFTRYEKVVHALAPAGVRVHGAVCLPHRANGPGDIDCAPHGSARVGGAPEVGRVANPKDEMWMAREGWSHKGQPRPTGSGSLRRRHIHAASQHITSDPIMLQRGPIMWAPGELPDYLGQQSPDRRFTRRSAHAATDVIMCALEPPGRAPGVC